MNKLELLEKEVLSNVRVKTKPSSYIKDYDVIIAYFCENQEQLDLVAAFEEQKCCTQYKDVKNVYSRVFKGADWYFFTKERVTPDSNVSKDIYIVETLTEKKESFQRFIDMFECEV